MLYYQQKTYQKKNSNYKNQPLRNNKSLKVHKSYTRSTLWFDQKGVYCQSKEKKKTLSIRTNNKQRIHSCQNTIHYPQNKQNGRKYKMKKIQKNSISQKKQKIDVKTTDTTLLDLASFQFINMRENSCENVKQKQKTVQIKKRQRLVYQSFDNYGMATIQHLLQKKQDQKLRLQKENERKAIHVPQNYPIFKESKSTKKTSLVREKMLIRLNFQLKYFLKSKHNPKQESRKIIFVNGNTLKFLQITVQEQKTHASIIQYCRKYPYLLQNFKKYCRTLNNFSLSLDSNIFICFLTEKYLPSFFVWISKPIKHFQHETIIPAIKKLLKQKLGSISDILADMGNIIWVISRKGDASYFKIINQEK